MKRDIILSVVSHGFKNGMIFQKSLKIWCETSVDVLILIGTEISMLQGIS